MILRCFAGAQARAGVNRINRRRFKLLCHGKGLRSAAVVQGNGQSALEPALGVEFRLSVANEQNRIGAHNSLSVLTNLPVAGTICGNGRVYHIEGSFRVAEEGGKGARQAGKLTQYGLAMVGGAGMTLMILGAGIGVIYGASLGADATHQLGLAIVAGLLMLLLAIGFWLAWVRPFERFDDINIPAEPEHH